ncbi:MAG: glycosyltransferase family 2 protein [bacterium]|nr:glycosyltransferase family 2 protein [bacterium]
MKSIIVVTYNSALYIDSCLASIEKNISSMDQVFVIDNNSNDNTVDRVEKFIANKNNFRLIVQKNNLGFASAVNVGLEISQGEYIFLINPDTSFKEGILEKTISLAKEKSADICGVRQINEKGKSLGSFGKYPSAIVNFFETTWLAKIFPIGRYTRYNFLSKKMFVSNRQVDWVGGGFMLLGKKVLEKIGKLDENFFMYFEDVDFCQRAKRAGLTVWFFGTIQVLHYGGKSFSDKNSIEQKKYSRESLKYFMQKK